MQPVPIDMKKESLKLLGGLAYVIAIIVVLSWLHLGFWMTVLFFATISLSWMLIMGIKDKKPISFKDWMKSIFWIIVIFGFIRLQYLIMPPAWAYVSTILFICGWIIYKRKKKWLEVKWTIEKMLFGERIKDLPKEYWKK